eukprot:2802919-Alexandrium_andersonii.AAC.1
MFMRCTCPRAPSTAPGRSRAGRCLQAAARARTHTVGQQGGEGQYTGATHQINRARPPPKREQRAESTG